jgi:hypothetical protein
MNDDTEGQGLADADQVLMHESAAAVSRLSPLERYRRDARCSLAMSFAANLC